LADAQTAFRRSVRLRRELARLVPPFFDAAVVQRERENRAAQRKWMATWQPYLEKAYGKDSDPPPEDPYPRLPHPNTQRAVDRRLAELVRWLVVGGMALERHRQRRPHGLMSLSRMAGLLNVAFDLKQQVLGLDSPNKLPEKITYDYEFTDLKRAYGHQLESASSVDEQALTAKAAEPSPPVLPSEPPSVTDPPPRRCDAYSRLTRQLRARLG
jgi:hypothetical protein